MGSSPSAHGGDRLNVLAGRNGGRVVLVAVAAVVALGLGLRLWAALNPIEDPGADAVAYERIAESLYQDGRYGSEAMRNPSDWSPGAPFFYAGVYVVSGGVNPTAARIAVAILGAATILFTYLLARRLGRSLVGDRAASWAAVAAALGLAAYPALIDNTRQFLTEPLAAFTVVSATLAFLWASEREGLFTWSLPGVLLGATALIRPEYLLVGAVFAVLALATIWRRRGWRPGLAAGALVAAAMVLPVLPWTARNAIVLDRFVPVTTGGGKALFIATYLPGDGRQVPTKRHLLLRFRGDRHVTYEERKRIPTEPLLDRVASKYPQMERDAALGRIGRENFRRYVRTRPFDYARMVVEKIWNVWQRGSSPAMIATGWVVFHRAILVLALLGLGALAWRRRWEALVMATPLLTITLVGGFLLAVPRRALPLMPLVLALAGAGAAWLVAEAVRRKLVPAEPASGASGPRPNHRSPSARASERASRPVM